MLVVLCTLLKVYLPALYRVATSNHTRVCLHSRELLRVPHTQGCLCVFYVHFIRLCVCVYPSELLLESPHLGLCVYMCLSELLLESPHLGLFVYMCLSELLLESPHLSLCVYMCLSELLLGLSV